MADWVAVAPLPSARYYHDQSTLSDGRVLVSGGYNGSAIATVSIYTPGTNTWAAGASLPSARYDHSQSTLSDGKVLVAGGNSGSAIADVSIYTPGTNTWAAGAALPSARYAHAQSTLSDGRVLVSGGYSSSTALADVLTLSFNQPPTLTNPTPAAGAVTDLAGTPSFGGTYSDPENNALAQLRFKRQRLDGTIEWWTGSAWQTTETAFAATSLPYTFPAGAFTEPSYRWAMAAADADSGAFSAYTAWQAVHNTNLFVRRGGAWVGAFTGSAL